jgi:hypothetical protein
MIIVTKDNVMKLTEAYLKYYEVKEQFENEFEDDIYTKLAQIVRMFEICQCWIDTYDLQYNKTKIYIKYGYHYEDYAEHGETIPIEWLDMSLNDIEVKVSVIKEQRRIELEKQHLKKIAENKKEQEEKERAMYEQLKKKFEG